MLVIELEEKKVIDDNYDNLKQMNYSTDMSPFTD